MFINKIVLINFKQFYTDKKQLIQNFVLISQNFWPSIFYRHLFKKKIENQLYFMNCIKIIEIFENIIVNIK